MPQYRREQFRKSLSAAFSLKGQRGRPLHTRHPLLEEGIHRALLPSWGEVVRGMGDHGPSMVTSLQSAGWRKSCAEHLVDYAERELTQSTRKQTSSDWG